MQLTQSLHRAVQQDPDRLMTVCRDRTRTVAESTERVARFAGALRSLGVRAGDRVAMLALNSDRYHEFLLGTPWAGGVVQPLNTRWSPVETGYALADCQPSVLLVDDVLAEQVPDLLRRAASVREVIFCGEGETPDGMLDYEDLVRSASPAEDARRADADLYGVFYTGGTTGRSRGVMLSHRAILSGVLGSLVSRAADTRDRTLLHAAPLFHVAGLLAWSGGLLTGAAHVMLPSFSPAAVLEATAKHRVTSTLLVPVMIQLLFDAPEAAGADLSSLREIMYGAAPISQAVLERARARLPAVEYIQGYGMTELGGGTTILTDADHRDPSLHGSCGRASAHCEIQIVGPKGNEVPRGEIGEIVVRGDHVMDGYWNLPEETAEALRDGWLHSGDVGYMDSRGYVFIVDRLKDMIITGGENVYSIEVENTLASHPAVAQAAVVGLPDKWWGERVHAFIVTRPGSQVSFEELQDHCRGLIAGYKVPRGGTFTDALPISGAGKVLKHKLRDRHLRTDAS